MNWLDIFFDEKTVGFFLFNNLFLFQRNRLKQTEKTVNTCSTRKIVYLYQLKKSVVSGFGRERLQF